MQITSVIKLEDGYKVNNQFFYASNDPFVDEINEWVASGGIIQPEYTPEQLLQRARDTKTAEIRTIKETELYKPVFYLGRTFISTERASGNIVGALQIISGDVFNWIDSNGNSIIMTRTEFEGLGTAILVQRSAVYSKEAEKYLEIKNAETVEEIEAIEW